MGSTHRILTCRGETGLNLFGFLPPSFRRAPVSATSPSSGAIISMSGPPESLFFSSSADMRVRGWQRAQEKRLWVIEAQGSLRLLFTEAVHCCEGFAGKHFYPTKKEPRPHVEEPKSSLKAAHRRLGAVPYLGCDLVVNLRH